MQSVAVYIGVFLIAILLARVAERTNRKMYMIFSIAIFSLVAGLRAETVGLDTEGYLATIRNIIDGRLELAYGLEWSFRYICYAFSFLIKEPQIYLLLFATATNVLVILRFWELKEDISFCWSVFIYYSMFYMLSLNLTRQFIAIAIVFYGTKFLLQGKNIKFLIFVAVAGLFHSTAVLSVVYIYFNVFNWSRLSKRQKHFLIFALLLLPIIAVYVYGQFIQYHKYMTTQSFDIGFMIVVKMLLVVGSILMLDKTEPYKVVESTKVVRLSQSALIVGLLLTSLGYAYRFVDRIGLYFYVFEAVYIGYVFKQKNTMTNFVIKMLFLMLYVYIFFGNTLGNGQGQNPYLFYWQ